MSGKQTLTHTKSHWKAIQSVTNKWLGFKLRQSEIGILGVRNEMKIHLFRCRALILLELIKINTSRRSSFHSAFHSYFLGGLFIYLFSFFQILFWSHEFLVKIVCACVSGGEARKLFGYKTAASRGVFSEDQSRARRRVGTGAEEEGWREKWQGTWR